MTNMLIELHKISKIYQKNTSVPVKAVDEVDLQIEAGDMIAIQGASGAGKSTLLHILGCLDSPTCGQYLLDGVDISQQKNASLSHIRNQKIGFIVQSFALIEQDTALENVCVPMLFTRKRFSKIEERAIHCMTMVSIEHLKNRKVYQLSGGEKQRVAIARALVNNPDIILADEPTGSLDTKNSNAIIEILQSFHSLGKTIVMITHEPQIAQSCNRTLTISDGKIVQ